MRLKKMISVALAGAAAGAITGLLGAGGGLLLVPILTFLSAVDDEDLFASSIAIMLPICIVSLLSNGVSRSQWRVALPYLLGSAAGGYAASRLDRKIPVKWLHRALGILIIWGGVKSIC